MDYALALVCDLLGYGAGLVVGTFIHEFGHAIAGWLLKAGPRLVNIGRGNIVCRLRILDAWLVVRAVPMGGSVASLPRGHDRRAATAAVIAAGPLANLLAFGALSPVFFGSLDLASADVSEFLIGFAGAQALLAGVALFPRQFKVGRDRRRHATDGLKLWTMLRRRDPDNLAILHATFMQHPQARNAPLPERTPDTSEILYQLGRWDIATDRWARRDSIEVLRRIFAAGRMGESEAAVVRTRLAVADANPELF